MDITLKAHQHILKASEQKYRPLHKLVASNGVQTLNTNPQDQSLFEFLARTVVGQQLSAKAARSIWAKVERLAQISKTNVIELFTEENASSIRECGLSSNKTKAIIQLRAAIDRNDINDEILRTLEYEPLKNIICSLWGFGEWSADMCAIFYCKQLDVFPSSDSAIVSGTQKLLGGSISVRNVFDDFSPYRSILCRHIWLALDSGYLD